MRTPIVVAAVAAVLIGLTSCSPTTPGDPVPGPAQSSADRPTAEPSTVTTPTEAPESPLAAVDPCDLLSASAQSSLGVTGNPEPGTNATVRGCRWRVRGESISESYTIGASIFESLSIEDAVSIRPLRSLSVGGRDAMEGIAKQNTGCFIAMKVTESSRVDVGVFGGDGEQLCPVALEAAELAEPELP